jgi:hypothetical protein
MKTKGLALMVAVGQALLIVSQCANPVAAIAAIGWKYWLFFLAMLVIFLFMVYFTYPETRGLTLEELAGFFEDNEVIGEMEKVEGVEVDAEVMKVETEVGKKA